MKNPFGPWATAMHGGLDPQLSTFWRQRMSRLPDVSKSSPSPSVSTVAMLALIAIVIFGLPTLRGWAEPPAIGNGAAAAAAPGVGNAGLTATKAAHKPKSYKYTASNEIKTWEETSSVKETGYWLADGSERTEATCRDNPFLTYIDIQPAGRPGVKVFTNDRSYLRYPSQQHNFRSPLGESEKAAELAAHAERQQGIKVVDGRRARGFVVDIKKIDPDFPITSGFKEIWIDVETNLPVLIHSKMIREDFISDRVAHYQWNVDLDAKLFDPTAPAGYKDVTEAPLPAEEQARRIVAALRVYAERCGGRYPRTRYVAPSNAQMELAAKLGLTGWPLTGDEFRRGPFAAAWTGFLELQRVENYRPECVYNGKTVGPKDKVLMRWKLDDGRYQVIFGDLRSEAVTAERLNTLEEGRTVDKLGVIRRNGKAVGVWGLDGPDTPRRR